MAIDRWNMFKQLFRKDWEQVRTETYFVLALALTMNLAVNIFNLRQATPLFIFIFVAPFLVPLYSAVQLFRREWSDGTIYLLLSLPVGGFFIFLSKQLAILLEFIIQTVGVFGLTIIFVCLFGTTDPRPAFNFSFAYAGDIVHALGMTSLIMLGGLALVTAAIFFSQSLSRLVPKYQALSAFVVFLFSLWLTIKIAASLGSAVIPFSTAPPESALIWQIAFFLLGIELMFAGLYLAAAAYIYDTKLEL
jgi:ABC-type transport system involved in multi-copper enzyme maturation permease subunit